MHTTAPDIIGTPISIDGKPGVVTRQVGFWSDTQAVDQPIVNVRVGEKWVGHVRARWIGTTLVAVKGVVK